MILTVTFNPALDVSGLVENLVPNEKSYVFDEVHTPGGNGINSGRIAHRLGSEVTLTGFLGGSNGKEIQELLKVENLTTSFVPIKGKTRMNLTVSNKNTHTQTRLSFPGPEISKKEISLLIKKINTLSRSDLLILGGSLPPGLEISCVKKLIQTAKKKKMICMVDMPGNLMKEVMSDKPDFIKPNLTEFQELTGKKVKTIGAVLKEARKLNLPLICISSVEGGALLLNQNEAWFGKIPKVKIYSTVGAGDSMVGAMARMLEKNPETSLEKLLQWGLAASCATLTEKGLTLGSRKNIQKYLPDIELKNIS